MSDVKNLSMAVWCVSRDNSQRTGAENHFNYWRISGDEEFRRSAKARRVQPTQVEDFVEVGVLLDDASKIDKVCIYLPQLVQADKVQDCSKYFESREIAQGIFNENIEPQLADRHIDLVVRDAPFCRVYRFSQGTAGKIDSKELIVEPFADGTLITIPHLPINVACRKAPVPPIYFRLRILVGQRDQSAFVHTMQTHDRFWQSGYDEVEFIDFRLNEARTLPRAVENKMTEDNANSSISLRVIAYLTAVPMRSELSLSNTESHKRRLLEQQIWSQYVDGGLPEGMVVYHWKKELKQVAQANRIESFQHHPEQAGDTPAKQQTLNDFAAFVRLQTRRSGRSTLLTYILVAFAFGVLGNLTASVIEEVVRIIW